MLPSYLSPNGATDVDSSSKRLQGPLLASRKARSGGSDNPVGLIVLTAACSLLLLIQVRDADPQGYGGRCSGALLGAAAAPPPGAASCRQPRLLSRPNLQLWCSTTQADS